MIFFCLLKKFLKRYQNLFFLFKFFYSNFFNKLFFHLKFFFIIFFLIQN